MRRFNVSGLAGWFVAAVVLVLGAGGDSETIRTKKIVIQDSQGRERIVMEISYGHPTIDIKTATGSANMRLGLGPNDEGYIFTMDKDKPHMLP